jgi:hypothetical protein
MRNTARVETNCNLEIDFWWKSSLYVLSKFSPSLIGWIRLLVELIGSSRTRDVSEVRVIIISNRHLTVVCLISYAVILALCGKWINVWSRVWLTGQRKRPRHRRRTLVKFPERAVQPNFSPIWWWISGWLQFSIVRGWPGTSSTSGRLG